jgi:hypothetical protein
MLVNIILGLILAAIAYIIAGIFLASPLPLLIALLVFVVVLLRDRINL